MLKIFLIALLISLAVCEDVAYKSTALTDSKVDNIVWCGNNKVQNEDDETIEIEDIETRITNIMFMLTSDGDVFITNTHGDKWVNFTKQIKKKFKSLKDEELKFRSVQVSPATPQTVFIFGKNGISFYADKCGKEVGIMRHEKDLVEFKLNRLQSDLILAHQYTKCNQFDDECEEGESKLYVSKDKGQNWEKILDNVYEANWDKLVHYAIVPDNRIIAHQRIYYSGKNNDQKVLTYSDDYYQSKKQIDHDVLHYYQSSYYLFVLANSETPDSYSLRTAPAFSQDYKPQEIDLPVKRIKDHSFTVLDSIQGQLYLAINHEGHNSKVTNVYNSDFNGRKYVLSLMNVVRNSEGNVDFERIFSHDGTFISNVYDQAELERIQNKEVKSRRSSYDKQVSSQNNRIESYRKSVISYNRGSSWHPLKAPEFRYNGEPYNCNGECSLHLTGRTDIHGNPIYSSDSAPGLILGTGNVGIYLEENEENMNTYLSNDGGHNWLEIIDRPHIYEIADRGGIIVTARSDKKTQHISYSWDHGKTWGEVKIFDTPQNIVNVITELSNMSQRFLVISNSDGNKKKSQGNVTSLDFSTLHTRICNLHWDPLDPNSDFEFWTPINYNEEKCLFGSRVKYIRRKPDSKCFNPEEYDDAKKIESCECTEEDFQCSFGFYRDAETNECLPMTASFRQKNDEIKATVPDPCYGSYVVPTGYEKIPANFCQGGVDLGPKRVACPEKKKEFDPNEYVPLEQEEVVDLEKITTLRPSPQTLENQKSFIEKYLPIILIVVIGYALYSFRDFILNLIDALGQSFKSGGSERGSGRLGSNYENVNLMNDDDEEEQL